MEKTINGFDVSEFIGYALVGFTRIILFRNKKEKDFILKKHGEYNCHCHPLDTGIAECYKRAYKFKEVYPCNLNDKTVNDNERQTIYSWLASSNVLPCAGLPEEVNELLGKPCESYHAVLRRWKEEGYIS